jgi:hypothetical protein
VLLSNWDTCAANNVPDRQQPDATVTWHDLDTLANLLAALMRFHKFSMGCTNLRQQLTGEAKSISLDRASCGMVVQHCSKFSGYGLLQLRCVLETCTCELRWSTQGVDCVPYTFMCFAVQICFNKKNKRANSTASSINCSEQELLVSLNPSDNLSCRTGLDAPD